MSCGTRIEKASEFVSMFHRSAQSTRYARHYPGSVWYDLVLSDYNKNKIKPLLCILAELVFDYTPAQCAWTKHVIHGMGECESKCKPYLLEFRKICESWATTLRARGLCRVGEVEEWSTTTEIKEAARQHLKNADSEQRVVHALTEHYAAQRPWLNGRDLPYFPRSPSHSYYRAFPIVLGMLLGNDGRLLLKTELLKAIEDTRYNAGHVMRAMSRKWQRVYSFNKRGTHKDLGLAREWHTTLLVPHSVHEKYVNLKRPKDSDTEEEEMTVPARNDKLPWETRLRKRKISRVQDDNPRSTKASKEEEDDDEEMG
jgi:hypothetical protein